MCGVSALISEGFELLDDLLFLFGVVLLLLFICPPLEADDCLSGVVACLGGLGSGVSLPPRFGRVPVPIRVVCSFALLRVRIRCGLSSEFSVEKSMDK